MTVVKDKRKVGTSAMELACGWQSWSALHSRAEWSRSPFTKLGLPHHFPQHLFQHHHPHRLHHRIHHHFICNTTIFNLFPGSKYGQRPQLDVDLLTLKHPNHTGPFWIQIFFLLYPILPFTYRNQINLKRPKFEAAARPMFWIYFFENLMKKLSSLCTLVLPGVGFLVNQAAPLLVDAWCEAVV